MSIKETLLTILTVTNYPEKDREGFCNRLLALAGQGALLLYVKDLPKEKQKELEEQIEGKPYEEIAPLFEHYLEEDALQKYFSQEINSIISDYVKEIYPDLTEEQKKRLDEFLATLPND